MIALAANGYQDLYTLLDAGEVPVDYIKCPGSPDSRGEVTQARAYRPVVLHGWGPPGYSTTRPAIPERDLLVELVAASGTPFVSVHLDYQPGLDGILEPAAVLDRVRREVATLKRLTGLDILLENVPWYPWQDRPRWGTDPSFITEAVESSGAEFLIDIAHARVSAWYRGEPEEEYIAALPLHLAREIHISGPRMSDRGLRDRHMSLREEDYALLDFVLDRTPNVELLTTEYAGLREATKSYNESDGPDRLAEDLAKLDRIRRGTVRPARATIE